MKQSHRVTGERAKKRAWFVMKVRSALTLAVSSAYSDDTRHFVSAFYPRRFKLPPRR